MSDISTAAEALTKTLGVNVEIGKERYGNIPALVIDITDNNPVADSTIKQLRDLNDELKQFWQEKGRTVDGVRFITGDDEDGKIRVNHHTIDLRNSINLTRESMPIAEFIEPLKDEYAKVIKEAPKAAKDQLLEKQNKINAATTEAANYAKQLEDIIGIPVTVQIIPENRHDAMQTRLAAVIGDGGIADSAIDSLVPIRAKAGLTKDDLPLGFDNNDGALVIELDDIKAYDLQHGEGALVKKLSSVKTEFSKVMLSAKAEYNELSKLKNLPPEAQFNATFLYNPDGTKKEGVNIEIVNGDFSAIPPEAIAEAIKSAKEIRGLLKEDEKLIGTSNPIEIRQFAAAAKLDGDKTTLTDKELAAYMLAKSISDPKVHYETTQILDGQLSRAELMDKADVSFQPKDTNLVFAIAQQILGDAMKEKIKDGNSVIDTTTPEGNKPYNNAVKNSPNTTHLRC